MFDVCEMAMIQAKCNRRNIRYFPKNGDHMIAKNQKSSIRIETNEDKKKKD